MPDLAERIVVEPKPRPVRRAKARPALAAPAAPKPVWRRVLGKLAPRSKRGFAGAALVATMIGIVVNATVLQHGHRIAPDPLATASISPPAAPAPITAPVAAPTSSLAPAREAAPTREAAPEPPARPATLHAAKPADPIADLLRTNADRRMIESAQSSLAKLGYSVKATGAMDSATRGALAEFERSRKLPVTAELTPKLVKTLNAASAE